MVTPTLGSGSSEVSRKTWKPVTVDVGMVTDPDTSPSPSASK
jgi:hypothetical protein